MARRAKVALELTFFGPQKGPDFHASITDFEKYCKELIKDTIGPRLHRYFVKFDVFQETNR